MPSYSFAEFFSGGGMARAGLGQAWECVLANDINAKKCSSYKENWSSEHLFEGDIAKLDNRLLHRNIDLYWASSPCQDFSLAGNGNGLNGRKSSAFHPWIKQVKNAVNSGHAPKIIAFENVVGLLSSNNGADFITVIREISRLGYHIGAEIIDAKHFVPHSRPRLFIVGVHKRSRLPAGVINKQNHNKPAQLEKAYCRLPNDLKKNWVWWDLGVSSPTPQSLATIIDSEIPDEVWFSKQKTTQLIGLMNRQHQEKMKLASSQNRLIIGTIYKRGRPDNTGKIVQRAELRLDGIAGCLRTPGGGSSRQTIMFIDGKNIRARLLTACEAARLMGLPDGYKLPENYNDAYHLIGDGVVVPVVRHLANKIFEPILDAISSQKAA